MNNAVGRLAYALDASREEQGLCPHEKNPAFDAGMFILARILYFSMQTSYNDVYCVSMRK